MCSRTRRRGEYLNLSTRKEVIEARGKLHKEEINNLCFSTDSRHVGDDKCVRNLSENLERVNQLEDLGVGALVSTVMNLPVP
jgi:hypothetical protein